MLCTCTFWVHKFTCDDEAVDEKAGDSAYCSDVREDVPKHFNCACSVLPEVGEVVPARVDVPPGGSGDSKRVRGEEV